jgi:hypothetical protein
LSASKKPSCPIVPKSANREITNQIRMIRRKSPFFEVPYRDDSGACRPGTLEGHGESQRSGNTGRTSQYDVQKVKWETDRDRDHRLAEEKRVRIAENERIRKQADYEWKHPRDPDAVTHCGIGGSSFWTTSANCSDIIDVLKETISGNRYDTNSTHRCAKAMAARFPGKTELSYLNICEELQVAWSKDH